MLCLRLKDELLVSEDKNKSRFRIHKEKFANLVSIAANLQYEKGQF